jgi:hypothetical protein
MFGVLETHHPVFAVVNPVAAFKPDKLALSQSGDDEPGSLHYAGVRRALSQNRSRTGLAVAKSSRSNHS